jgi:uncharacterized membrane protein
VISQEPISVRPAAEIRAATDNAAAPLRPPASAGFPHAMYDAIKLVHILGTVLIFGTGLGTAFFLLMAYRARDLAALRVTARHVIVADWLFTAPAVVVQPITGAWLMHARGMSFDTLWFALVAALYLLTGLCWIPVVRIQYRLRDLARDAPSFAALPDRFRRLMRWWVLLGIPAFTAVAVIVALMVTQAGVGVRLGALS